MGQRRETIMVGREGDGRWMGRAWRHQHLRAIATCARINAPARNSIACNVVTAWQRIDAA